MRLLWLTFATLLAGSPAFALSVSLFTPTNGAVMPAGEITVHALPIDSNYPILRVEFFRNGVAIGVATNVPFSVTIDDHPPGHFRFLARAQNSLLATAESAPVVVRVGSPPIQVVRGPYLQSGSPTGMVIRWRTDWFVDSVVRYGTNNGELDRALTNAGAKVDHEIALTGLQPDRRYYYSIGSSTQTLASGSNCYFRTSPMETRPVRLWVIGDSGTSDTNAASVRDAYQAATGGAETDLWLMLGDNAYSDGLDQQFQTAVFDMYPDLLRHTVLWPTLGNHDAGDDPGPAGNQGRFHLDAFTLPKQGESGGLPSGSELYYSFDYANLHVICLDSFISDNSPGSPMLMWLKNDLAATEKDWILAFWHFPPYTKSTHDSDGEVSLARMRENVLPILEDHGVDLVLCGHSHSYERSFLLDGHYGSSWTLQPGMVLDGGYGRTNQDGAYLKPAGGLGEHRGCVYAVCGCSGEGGAGEGFTLHPAMKLNHGGYGSMIIEIDGLRLEAQFLRPSGVIDDHFTIDKSIPTTLRPKMEMTRATNGLMISWPTSHPAFDLQTAPTLPATQWSMVAPAQTQGRRNFVTLPATNESRFFQLRRQP